MNKIPALPGILIAASIAVAACAKAEDEKRTFTLDAEQPTAVDVEANGASKSVVGPGMQRLVDLATETLASNIGVDNAAIEVAKAEFVTWRDSSLGCAQPGMQYMQVLTNGSRIILSAGGKIYNFHSGGNTPPTYCPKPSPDEPLPYGPGES